MIVSFIIMPIQGPLANGASLCMDMTRDFDAGMQHAGKRCSAKPIPGIDSFRQYFL